MPTRLKIKRTLRSRFSIKKRSHRASLLSLALLLAVSSVIQLIPPKQADADYDVYQPDRGIGKQVTVEAPKGMVKDS